MSLLCTTFVHVGFSHCEKGMHSIWPNFYENLAIFAIGLLYDRTTLKKLISAQFFPGKVPKSTVVCPSNNHLILPNVSITQLGLDAQQLHR